tara:strand:+ start:313 stop:1257 length:945 start_codon:yes stop_codon:yes gene_type:complete
MAFLDNSGDIILDAVLTDVGRARLASGRFRIAKFGFGDDEVNYALYHNNNHVSGKSHPSGSAYYDIEILQTPVLEAFTNNGSSMKSRLISLTLENVLHLGTMAINNKDNGSLTNATYMSSSGYIVAVDQTTQQSTNDNFANLQGVLFGENPESSKYIRVDQGLNTTEIPATRALDSELKETQYTIEIDNRLVKLIDPGGRDLGMSTLDDDDVATYNVSLGTDSTVVSDPGPLSTTAKVNNFALSGPRGTSIKVSLRSSLDVSTSNRMFELLGSTVALATAGGAKSYRQINTTVRVTGVTTGYEISVPVRLLKSV